MNLLLIDDDREAVDYVVQGLTHLGHNVDVAIDGRNGFVLVSEKDYDVLIVDRMLPHLDGLSLVKLIRENGKQTPVLFLTTMSGIDDRVEGLECGGDDYLVKPFAFPELCARLNALARRPRNGAEITELQVGPLRMDLISQDVSRDGTKISLNPLEFRLLKYFMHRPEYIITRTMLLEFIWDYNFDPRTKVVETNISRLRTKMDKPYDVQMLQTVRGVGYVLKADGGQ